MKTRRYIKSEAKNDFERIMEAHRLVMEHIQKHPGDKVTCTIPLSNGTYYTATATPVA